MASMNHSFTLDCEQKKLFKILTDFENLSNYLPRKLQNIEILEKNGSTTMLNVSLFLRTLIKKEFSQKIKIDKKSENSLIIEVLDGHAKGTHIEISLSSNNEKTICQVNSDVKLSLKIIVLLPILKAEYNVFVANVFKKMAKESKEIRI